MFRTEPPDYYSSRGDLSIYLCLGPNPQTTIVAEEIWMQFVANKEEAEKEQVKLSFDLKPTHIWLETISV